MSNIRKPRTKWAPTGYLRLAVRSGYVFIHPDEIVETANQLIDRHDEYENNGNQPPKQKEL